MKITPKSRINAGLSGFVIPREIRAHGKMNSIEPKPAPAAAGHGAPVFSIAGSKNYGSGKTGLGT